MRRDGDGCRFALGRGREEGEKKKKRKKKAALVTLRLTFSEKLIPRYNRLQGRYGKLLHRYLGCLGDHQSTTGAAGDAAVLKRGARACARARVLC